MSVRLDDGTIDLLSLDTADDSIFQNPCLNEAWNTLARRSAEAIQDMRMGLYEFMQSEKCIYIAVILLKPSQAEMDEWEQMKILNNARHPFPYYPENSVPPPQSQPIGLIYAASAEPSSSVNIGLSILPHAQGNGYGARAVHLLMGLVFHELRVHRVQARIINLEDDASDATQQMFTTMGFVREGTARRALLCPLQDEFGLPAGGNYRDVITYAMLDTDWTVQVLRPKKAVKTMWDAMFARHELESDEHVAIEERTEQRRRRARQEAESSQAAEQNQPTTYPPPHPPPGNLFRQTVNVLAEESATPSFTTPLRARSTSPALSQSSASSSSMDNSSYHRLAAFRGTPSAMLASRRFAQTPWAELLNTPSENASPEGEPSTPYESADEIPMDSEDDDGASTVSSFSSIGREDLLESDDDGDAASVVSVPRSESVLSDASESSWLDVADSPDAHID